MKLRHCSLLALAALAAAPAAAKSSITCYERVGGWCEEDGTCHSNTLKPAEFRFSALSLPRDGQSIRGELRECREGNCGKGWPAAIRFNGLDLLISVGESEHFQIHPKTGFFAHTSMMSSEQLGRVKHAFGHCLIP